MPRCQKRRYRNYNTANMYLLKLQDLWKGDPNRKPKRVYFCHRCKRYHLTSREYGY